MKAYLRNDVIGWQIRNEEWFLLVFTVICDTYWNLLQMRGKLGGELAA